MVPDPVLKPVPLSVAGTASAILSSDLAVYLPGAEGRPPVLYREVIPDLSMPDCSRLRESGVDCLLVRGEDLARCEAELEARLGRIMQDPRIEPDQKASYARYVGLSVARSLAGEGDLAQPIDRADHLLDDLIEGLLEHPGVAENLLRMSLHHRSTASHMFAVSTLGMLLGAEVLGREAAVLKDLGLAGLLHDVGKMAIDPKILNKTEPLTPEELRLIQRHPVESIRIIGDNPRVSTEARKMILQHHERVDGEGYPLGLGDEELLTGSKILTVVDCFHALIGKRSYRRNLSPPEAMGILRAQVGRQFDPGVFGRWEVVFGRCWDAAARVPELSEDADIAPAYHADHRRPRSAQTARRAARLPCAGRVTVKCVYVERLSTGSAAPDEFVSSVRDVSRSGLCMCFEHPMYLGEIVHILIEADGCSIWVRGVVRWCRRMRSGSGHRVGVQFLHRLGGTEDRPR